MTVGSPTRRDGVSGAVAAGHPLAVGAALQVLAAGGTAVDAAIAAQAVLCVVMPDACGLGGDAMCLVRTGPGRVTAINGTGATPAAAGRELAIDAGASVTVPGIVSAWGTLHSGWGRLPFDEVLAPAERLARQGHRMGETLAKAVTSQRARLLRGGAANWPLTLVSPGSVVSQPALARTLEALGAQGPDAFYRGALAGAIASAVRRDGGSMTVDDLARHATTFAQPITISWDGGLVHLQPPTSQGVLLAMALSWLERQGLSDISLLDHICVELTEAAFGYRDRCVRDGVRLLEVQLDVDTEKSSRRGGPRAYLHTTGVAVADAQGVVVSSLLSVFDDFGSCTYVPEGGFVLNNRAGGFTAPPNDPGPGRMPVHTLAPALLERDGGALALATPGADGQVQTLLQVLTNARYRLLDLHEAIRASRWRSEEGVLLIERDHPALGRLTRQGHAIAATQAGDPRFGAVVSAWSNGAGPGAAGDWRRDIASGVL